jgi:hypothetical protein
MGWTSWSWDSSINLRQSPGFSSEQALGWTINKPWAGLYLHSDVGVQLVSSSKVELAIRAKNSGQKLMVGLDVAGKRLGPLPLSQFGGDPQLNTWKLYSVPLSAFSTGGGTLTGLILQDAVGGASPVAFDVDDVGFTGLPVPPTPTSTPTVAPTSTPTASPTPVPATGSGCSSIPAYPEIRPGNTPYNMTRGQPTDPSKVSATDKFRPYFLQVNGDCTGTTEQILEWAARKWGFADQPSPFGGPAVNIPDLAKAQAVIETWWRQTDSGSHGEVGILQVNPNTWPDWEKARVSTAFAADYAMAVVRMHYDGNSWVGASTRGNIRNAVAAWECGCANNGYGNYTTRVFDALSSKLWKRPMTPPEWF